MREESIPIQSNISFADSTLKSFNYEEKNRILNVFLEAWNEKIVKITFKNVLYFDFKPGDFISEIYNDLSESSLLNEVLLREYNKIPENELYKLIVIKDIDEFLISNIVCNEVLVLID